MVQRSRSPIHVAALVAALASGCAPRPNGGVPDSGQEDGDAGFIDSGSGQDTTVPRVVLNQSGCERLASAEPFASTWSCGSFDSTRLPDDVSLTPRADRDAEWISLRGLGSVVADDATYSNVKCEIDAIRAAVPAVDFDLHPLWYVGLAFDVVLTVDSLADLDAESRSLFDCVTAELGGVVDVGTSGHALVETEGLFWHEAVKEIYLAIHGVLDVQLNVPPGDGPEINLNIVNDVYSYTFIKKFGDCASGCTQGEAHKIEVDGNGTVTLVDQWSGTAVSAPGWVQDAALFP